MTAVAEARVERAEQGLVAAERRRQVGSATRSDVLRATLEMNTAREAVLQARTARNTAAYALGRLIGAEGPAQAVRSEEVAPRPLALSDQELLALLERESPSVAAAEAELRSAGATVSATRTQYLPTVRASSGYDWYNQDPAIAAGRTSWSMRLSLSYPIFDGFRREESMERVRVQEQVAEMRLADARRGVRADAERVLGELRLAGDRIALLEEAVTVAEEDLRVQQELYALGASTILDLLASQTALVEAQNDLVSARFDYRLARAEFEALAGRAL
jgi:outer membrane protein